MSIKEIKEALAAAKAKHLAESNSAEPHVAYANGQAVKALQKALSDAICEGAKPCPNCGAEPWGMEQPAPNARGVEYEIGCRVCKPFEHKDGSVRAFRARGGLMPKHTVDAWNEGPDFWLVVKPAPAKAD